MSTLIKKIEITANIAIIAVALLIGGVAVKRYLLTETTAKPDQQILNGSKVALRNVDWEKSDQTLLLVLQKGCRFCTESAPFYQRLVRETAGRADIRLIAVFAEDAEDAKEYLRSIEVPIDEVKKATPGSLGASGTPTLILVNKAGEIASSWVGRLSAGKEAEVLNRLNVNSSEISAKN